MSVYQRPIVLSDDTTIAPDRNLTIVIDTDDITVTLNAAEFIGCNVTILPTFSSGSANVLCGSDTYTVESGNKINLIWNGDAWQEEAGGSSGAPVGLTYEQSRWLIFDFSDSREGGQ